MNHYFLIYKPYLVLSQFSPVAGKKTLADFFDVPRDVYPVGRLDHDSEGLLLLTNDASLNQRLLHPRHAHRREYWVQVDGDIHPAAIASLRKGVVIQVDGKPYATRPCEVRRMDAEPELPPRTPPIRFRKNIPAPWFSMVLTEGKNRQVRKMTAAAGFPTLRLVRYRVEQLSIAGMEPGGIRSFTKDTLYQKLFYGNNRQS